MDILHIFSDFINRYFSNETDGIKAGYLTATGILTNLIPEHIEEEERQTIDVTEEQFNDLRKIATTSYCFDVFGIRKSRFIEGGGGRMDPVHRIQYIVSQKLCSYVE